jgi:poly-gamma-glutamate synthesis protein (capsule biosynthesis protein)
MDRAVIEARKRYDHVVVAMHWGWEYGPVQPYQKEMVRRLTDAGADVVVGHHPHVVQQADRHGNTLVLYSLGNFFFGTAFPAAWDSVVARVTLRRGLVPSYVPVAIDARTRPRPAQGVQADRVLYILRNGFDHKGSHAIPADRDWLSERDFLTETEVWK